MVQLLCQIVFQVAASLFVFLYAVFVTKFYTHFCGMYILLSNDEHRFVQKVHPTYANGHWECGCKSNPIAMLPHAAVVLYATI